MAPFPTSEVVPEANKSSEEMNPSTIITPGTTEDLYIRSPSPRLSISFADALGMIVASAAKWAASHPLPPVPVQQYKE